MLSMDSIKHVVGWNRMPFFKKNESCRSLWTDFPIIILGSGNS